MSPIRRMLRIVHRMSASFCALFSIALPALAYAADDTTCARVQIEIRQELTLERQAFDAHMRINNGLTGITLENVGVVVDFADDAGNTVQATSDPNNTGALFFIRVDTMSNIADVGGAGTVAPSTSADIHWLIVPAPGAANGLASGKLYYVGATLSYTIGGEPHVTKVTPDFIYVKPMPKLTLDYFLTSDVYGDDAFTPEIEPVVPFSLGVRVSNSGAGEARSVKIESAQPQIVDNEQGLLINFLLEGSEVNGQPVTPSLLADFGDIPPHAAGTGRWIMTCSLSGRFVDFSATFTHADELGGQLTSLIEAVNTHLLVHDVLVDLPGRDGVRDFLAKDGGVYRVYESDNVNTDVTDQSAFSGMTLHGTAGTETRYTLSAPVTAGLMYVQMADPFSGQKIIKSVTRSDGKEIAVDNRWLSKSRTGSQPWQYFVKLFDVNTTDGYTVVFEDASAGPRPPVLQFIPDRAREIGQQLSFLVEASDPNGTIPSISAAPLPVGASFTDRGDGVGIFDWTPAAGQEGKYQVTFRASDGALEASQFATISIGQVNKAPTLDAIADISMNENEGERTIPLQGISAGPGEDQELTVIATSSNTELIPNPTVTYTSPNATGSLSIASVANTHGTATITVTVSDGQSSDSTVSRQFVVIVHNVPSVQFSLATSSGLESSSPAAIQVRLSEASGQTIRVNYSTAAGTGTVGNDYSATAGVLTFAAGVVSQTIDVPIIDDSMPELDETFTVTLTNPVNAVYGATTTHVYTIKSDDTPVGFRSISAGGDHTLAIKDDGTLWAWGWNRSGQLGDGTDIDRYFPVKIGPDSDWATVVAGSNHTLALKENGTLWAWGENSYGELGTPPPQGRNLPAQLGTDANWVSMAGGYGYSIATKSDGTLWAWGRNAFGDLGDGTSTDRHPPVQIGADRDWVHVSGRLHTVALKSDGGLGAWGWNNGGCLGDGTTTDRYLPVQIGTTGEWIDGVAGAAYTVALKSDASLWSWGNNEYGRLGDGTTTERRVPVRIGTGSDWDSISAGTDHTVGLKSDATLWAWGRNVNGQLGDATGIDRYTPVQIGADANWIFVAAGHDHTVGLKSDGSIWAWGRNAFGEVGDGSTANRNSPTRIIVDVVPEMNLTGNGVSIADGDVTPAAGDHTDFGATDIAGGSVTRSFTIQNTGTATLTLSGSPLVAIGAANAGDFTVIVHPAVSIEAGASTTFQITFDPSAEGGGVATISIANSDANENPYDFAIRGTGIATPEINVLGNAKSIASGDIIPATADHTDFGSTEIDSGTVARTFSVQNSGSGILVLSGMPLVMISGTNAADFTVTGQPDVAVAAAGATSFEVRFDPSSVGLRVATISIANNDADENPYSFSVQGTGTLESVSAPLTPSGPTNLTAGVMYSFTTGGADCSSGDAVQYRFLWSDTPVSAWLPVGTIMAAKSWSVAGSYSIHVQARCATHPTVVSSLGDPLIVTVTPPPYQSSAVTVSGRQLLLEGSPFMVKGVVYSPVPIGVDPETAAPYGDYFTADYAGLQDRDLELLRRMGANTVQIPYWANTSDHRSFLDKAYSGGEKPIHVIAGFWINPGLDIDPASPDNVRDQLKADFQGMVESHRDHPAILLWSIGSDVNAPGMYGGQIDNLFSLIDEMANLAHMVEGSAAHPVVVGLADNDLAATIAAYDSVMPNLDLWGVAAFRGNSFGSLFADYKAASSKPLVVLGYGIDAYDRTGSGEYENLGTPEQANHALALWGEIAANVDSCVGGAIMEYSDEWWRGKQMAGEGCPDSDPAVQSPCGQPDASQPDGFLNEEWRGIVRVADDGDNPDLVQPRQAYLALQSLWAPAGIDLVVNSVSAPPDTVLRGGKFSVTDTTRNQGGAATGRTTNTRYYLSMDLLKNTGDRLLSGTRSVPNLAAGAVSTGTVQVTVSTSTPVGTYYLLACTDDTSLVAEANEGNNCAAAGSTVSVVAPDLATTGLSGLPGAVLPGGYVTVSDSVQNLGGAGTGKDTVTRFWLSTDTSRSTTADKLLASTRAVPALGAGESSTGATTLTIPATTAAGKYYLLACADDTALVAESSESNNCKASASTFGVSLPDLVEAVTAASPTSLSKGGSLSVSDTATNQGVAAAAASTTRYYLSLDSVKGTGDVLLASTRSVPSLAAGESFTGTLSLTVPTTAALGTYKVLACADDLAKVTEGNETNNCAPAPVSITVLAPDLVEADVVAPASAVVGTAFAVGDTTTNVGNAATAVGSTTRYYLSADTVMQSADKLLTGTRAVPVLAPGECSEGGVTVIIPAGTAVGDYHLLACADGLAKVVEGSETNNCVASATTIAVTGVDLVESAVGVSIASAKIGTSFSVTDTLVNQGNAAMSKSVTTRYWLSLDIAKSTSTDKLLTGTRVTAATLDPGASSTGTAMVIIPTTTVAGTYYVLACADDTAAQYESHETNNCTASGTMVTVSP